MEHYTESGVVNLDATDNTEITSEFKIFYKEKDITNLFTGALFETFLQEMKKKNLKPFTFRI